MLIANLNMNVANGNQVSDTWATPGGDEGLANFVIAGAGLGGPTTTAIAVRCTTPFAGVQPLQASGLQMLLAVIPNTPSDPLTRHPWLNSPD